MPSTSGQEANFAYIGHQNRVAPVAYRAIAKLPEFILPPSPYSAIIPDGH